VAPKASEDCDAFICKAQAVHEEPDCLCLADKGTTILQHIRHHSANDTASHLRRLEFKQFQSVLKIRDHISNLCTITGTIPFIK
jgi:hypothetical protein